MNEELYPTGWTPREWFDMAEHYQEKRTYWAENAVFRVDDEKTRTWFVAIFAREAERCLEEARKQQVVDSRAALGAIYKEGN